MSNTSLALLPPTQNLLTVLANPKTNLIAASCVLVRDDLIDKSKGIERVAGQASQDHAVALLKDVQEMLKFAEGERKRAKDPFATIGKHIDAQIKQFTAPLEAEKSRVKNLVDQFQFEQIRAKQELERKQAEELAKLRAEQQAAAQSGNEEAKLAAEMKAVEVVMAAPILNTPKSDGLRVSMRWNTVVNDPAALFKVFPELCEVVPRMMAINAAVKRMAETEPDKAPVMPGCTITKVVITQTA